MIRKGNMCICFKEVPEGTHFRAGAYSWVEEPLAREYISDGYADEYNPFPDPPKEAPTFEVINPFPRPIGGGWWELSNGEKEQGEEKARKREQSI